MTSTPSSAEPDFLPVAHLRCHPIVVEVLLRHCPPAEHPLGAVGDLLGLPVIPREDMEEGAWEIRGSDGTVAGSGCMHAEVMGPEDTERILSGDLDVVCTGLPGDFPVEFRFPSPPSSRLILDQMIAARVIDPHESLRRMIRVI